jgi:nitrate reductase assembly molybdenum cofactor insertion protein NarJ
VFEVFKQALQVCTQVNKSSWRECLIHFTEFIRENGRSRIPLGEFTNHHESLDLAKVQGRYNDTFPKCSKFRRGGAID